MSDEEILTFGKLISEARKRKNITITDCAALINKTNGTSISVQYLSDLEKDRRNPPSELILKQLSDILNIPIVVLYFYSEKFPPGLSKKVSQEQIIAAYQAFFERLGHNSSN